MLLPAARKEFTLVTLGWPCWIGVVADDLDRQRRFYRDVLGFTEIAAGEDWVHFDLGDSRLLEIVRRSGQPQYDQARYQVGYAVEDIEDAREQLIALGVQPVSDLEGSAAASGRWCYFRDAEGNVFELKERRQQRA
jgi:catechol 2,3-dioxygenase-like lactoylglutathione lyase family enzyme